jgi:hypothetical protein
VFAEFETNLRRERQLEGIAAGVYKGRPASIDGRQVAKLKAEGLGASQIARRLGVARECLKSACGNDEGVGTTTVHLGFSSVSTGANPMRIALAVAGLVFAAPALAKTAQGTDSTNSVPMAAPKTSSAGATTTPSMVRPGDEDLKASNRKGGAGGKNSDSNGG